MKSGYAAGAVAGFIVGIAATIFGAFTMPYYSGLSLSEILQFLPFTATMHIVFNVCWGVVWGVLFAKFYDVIPGESGVKKGLFWGFIYALIEWWCGSYNLLGGLFWATLTWAIYGPIVILFYGLPLGYLYEGTQQPIKIEDKRKHKLFVSVIAGLVIGIVLAVLRYVLLILGIPSGYDLLMRAGYATPLITNFVAMDFILGTIWGIIFSIMFVWLYPRLPGKNIMKGIYYGLIIYSITVIYFSIAALMVYASMPGMVEATVYAAILLILAYIVYGFVLGYFYKKE